MILEKCKCDRQLPRCNTNGDKGNDMVQLSLAIRRKRFNIVWSMMYGA
jgi:hypothetical protein